MSLIWGTDPTECFQGVSELTIAERCKDEWYLEMLDECRAGYMTDTTHAFLHGLPTSVPGSWERGTASCGRVECAALEGKDWQLILAGECDNCRTQRASKQIVATGPDDIRFSNDTFRSAPLIVPNNDTKYHTNKTRSQLYSQLVGNKIEWAQAKDTPTAEVLQSTPCDINTKLKWLQRHDKESGNLYGMLPLIQGMPVVLTDHLDRSRDKNLLRGTRGRLRSLMVSQDDASET